MKNYLSVEKNHFFQGFMLLSILFLSFNSFAGKGLQVESKLQSGIITDTLPDRELVVQVYNTDKGNLTKDSVMTRVLEIEASFPGGSTEWTRYLCKAIRYPEEAMRKGVMGNVIVEFLINADGTVGSIESVSGTTKAGLGEEAVRIIKKSGKWNPATYDGVPVKSNKNNHLLLNLQINLLTANGPCIINEPDDHRSPGSLF